MLNALKQILASMTMFAFRNSSCRLSATTSSSAKDNYELAGGPVREFKALETTMDKGKEE